MQIKLLKYKKKTNAMQNYLCIEKKKKIWNFCGI